MGIDWIIFGGIALCVVLVVGLVALLIADEREWQKYADEHHCVEVEHTPDSVATTVVMTGGTPGTGVTFIPGKTKYVCDGGKVIWR